MQPKQLAQTVDNWRQYICNKQVNPRAHKDITALLKKLNNNQSHIHPMVTKQSRDIIDKIVHAFSESLITIYDTNLFESICDIIFSHPYACNMISDDIKIHIKDYITQTPWLSIIHQGFICTLDLIRDYVSANHIDNTIDSGKSNPPLHNHINESIYNIINCWIISCVTLLFCKALFGMPTLELNLPYLFFVAASYSIVDFAIDDNTVKIPIVKTILKLFEYGITCADEITQTHDQFTDIPAHIFHAIRHLIQTYKHHVDPNTTKLNAIFYSMTTEKECFKRQRVKDISADEIITLTINKGLSTGYLILAGLPQTVYDLCVNPAGNNNNLVLFSQYCILLQLLDDLSDYTQDSVADISTLAKLFTTYPAFAWFVLDCLLDFLQGVQDSVIFDKWQANGFNIIFVNYWCYCCNKNIKLISDTGSDTELMNLITANYMFDMEYVLQMREQKHKKKYELYKLLIQGQLNK